MKKSIFLFLASFCFVFLNTIFVSAEPNTKIKAGVILSGCGIQDGTEIYEAAFTILALENANAEIIMMAPNIPQANVINHFKKDDKTAESRNVLVESARIARGKIKDIKDVKAEDLDILIIPGGMGSIITLSDFNTKGVNGVVNPEVEKLIKDMYAAKKPIGSMCAASLILAKILGNKQIKITIGKNNKTFGPIITSFGATHIESTSDNIVIDTENKIVTTPAFMGGASNSLMYTGIDKMIKETIKFVKK
jgi:enhancing lycopene biosynthesis protein 2